MTLALCIARRLPDRRSWLKVKCLNREEFVVVGWSDPEGSRHRIGSLLLGYYAVHYAPPPQEARNFHAEPGTHYGSRPRCSLTPLLANASTSSENDRQ